MSQLLIVSFVCDPDHKWRDHFEKLPPMLRQFKAQIALLVAVSPEDFAGYSALDLRGTNVRLLQGTKGLGGNMRSAFDAALLSAADRFLILDFDRFIHAAHFAADELLRILETLASSPAALLFGCRTLEAHQSHPASQWQSECSVNARISQTIRLFPLDLMAGCTFLSRSLLQRISPYPSDSPEFNKVNGAYPEGLFRF